MMTASLGLMLENLALATVMVCLTVSMHFVGLLLLLKVLRHAHHFVAKDSMLRQGALILFVVLGIVAIHTAEIWVYAIVYLLIGALGDLESALYFSTVTFASLGYGDITLDRAWRLFGSIEAANGVILFAWSTAFLFAVTSRLRVLEHDWLERND